MKKTLLIFVGAAFGTAVAILAMTAWLNEQDKKDRKRALGRR